MHFRWPFWRSQFSVLCVRKHIDLLHCYAPLHPCTLCEKDLRKHVRSVPIAECTLIVVNDNEKKCIRFPWTRIAANSPYVCRLRFIIDFVFIFSFWNDPIEFSNEITISRRMQTPMNNKMYLQHLFPVHHQLCERLETKINNCEQKSSSTGPQKARERA